ncbi:hypothetical protein ACXJJ3_02965 [Kribbella sp. WER1]
MAEPTASWAAFDYAVVDVEGNGQQPPDLVEISIAHRATYDAIVCARLLLHLATPPGRQPLAFAQLFSGTADEPTATLF